MRSEGVAVCLPDEQDASLQSVRVGFLNMMPDTAITATERQFLRLVSANSKVNCYFYPFSIEGVERSSQATSYTQEYYLDFDQLKLMGVDALIITGANVSQPSLKNEPFWNQLQEVLNWARSNVRSTVCSCLATHAAVKVFYGIDRRYLGNKCWGVFPHDALIAEHILLKDVEKNILMCHSRFNDISSEDFLNEHVDVLIESKQVGVQLACEKDMRIVYFQGHPEYDDLSLLKEYKREIFRYLSGQRDDYPPVPDNYFNQSALHYINEYKLKVENASNTQGLLEHFPEHKLRQEVDDPWKSSAQTVFSNWLGILTN